MNTADIDFDPNQVPVFPVLNIEVTADGGARLNGRVLPVDPGQDPTEVAVAAAAAEARLLPGDHGAIRVRAVDATGNPHPMVVRADGAAFDLTPARPSGSHPTWWLPAAAAAITVILGAGVIVTVAVVRSNTNSTAPVAATTRAALTGAGANLPIAAPPGYGQQATWAVPVSDQVPPIPTQDGDLLAETTNGDLVLLDAQSGRTLWTGSGGGDVLHTFSGGGQSIAASDTGTTLSLWALPAKDTKTKATITPTAVARAVTVALPSQATVSYDGAAPLITLPDQTAAFVSSQGLARVDVPVGAPALAADSSSIIAAGTDGAWYDLTPGAKAVAKHLTPPAGTTGAHLLRTIAAGGTHLVGVWATATGQSTTLYDLGTGKAIASGSSPSGVDLTSADVLHQPGGNRLTLGPVLVDYGQAPAVVALGATFSPAIVTAGHIYGQVDQSPAEALITGQAVTISAISGTAPVAVIATSASTAYVAAAKVEQYLLYAVPTTGGKS